MAALPNWRGGFFYYGGLPPNKLAGKIYRGFFCGYWLIVIGPALGLLMLFGTISLQLQDSTLSPQVGSSRLLYLNVLDGVTWLTQSCLSIYAGRGLRDRFEPASVRYAILI
ncbi:MAG: hypothetical protein LH618_03710, partial [Saprospiraceae bacterium]|nr:hypothetical protein [Saprospiraceae bacterium]